jgi:hypothetical protein
VAPSLPFLGLFNLLVFKGSLLPEGSVGRVSVRAPTGSTCLLVALAVSFGGALLLPSLSCKINGVPHPLSSPQCLGLFTAPFVFLVLVAFMRLAGVRLRARQLLNEVRESLPRLQGAA